MRWQQYPPERYHRRPHPYKDIDAFLARYDELDPEGPIYLTISSGRVPIQGGEDSEVGYFVIATFLHGKNVYVCYQRAEYDSDFNRLYDRWFMHIQKTGHILREGIITWAWPLDLAAGPEGLPPPEAEQMEMDERVAA
jgi:hypothetical protein